MPRARRKPQEPPPEPKSQALFAAEPPTREIAWQMVERIPLDAWITKERRGGRFYWYAQFLRGGRKLHEYIGSDQKLAGLRACHAVARAELHAAEESAEAKAAPELAHLRALRARAFSQANDGGGPGIASVPILNGKALAAAASKRP